MSSPGPIVWIAGTNWDGVAGTDKRIVESLARSRPVLWVDPPTRATLKTAARLWSRPDPRGADGTAGLERVSDSILRLRVTALPGVTRPGVRRLTALLLERAITSALSRTGWEPDAVVVAMPLARFPRRTPGTRILYLTDDWLEGARLMGLSQSVIRRVLDSNLSQADGVAAVSEALLAQVQPVGPSASGRVFAVVPNGCPSRPRRRRPRPASPPRASSASSTSGWTSICWTRFRLPAWKWSSSGRGPIAIQRSADGWTRSWRRTTFAGWDRSQPASCNSSSGFRGSA